MGELQASQDEPEEIVKESYVVIKQRNNIYYFDRFLTHSFLGPAFMRCPIQPAE
jgi:hypothetical protein